MAHKNAHLCKSFVKRHISNISEKQAAKSHWQNGDSINNQLDDGVV